jgi:hypothetical protein
VGSASDSEPRAQPPPRRPRRAPVRITERDRELLAFAAGQRLITAAHAQALLGASAGLRRIRALTRAGLLEREPVHVDGRAPVFRITTAGCRLAGSRLTRPRASLGAIEHDLGVAWLHLAALAGRFGPVTEVTTEREMRSHDARGDRRGLPRGVRIPGAGAGGRERLHYPDLLIRTATGHTIAIELELSSKQRTRREGILGAYGAEPRIDAVVYLSDTRAIGRAVQASARRLGMSSLVHVQRCEWGASARVPGSARAREHARRTARGDARRDARGDARRTARGDARASTAEAAR